MAKVIEINRAPVLTLWAAVVAERLGYDWDESLTLGKCVAGLNAQAKGRSLGIYRAKEGAEKARKKGLGEEFWVEVCGRPVPAKRTDDGVRAVVKDKAIDPGSVATYLEKKFGDGLDAARKAMEELARSMSPEELEERSYSLYESFRPNIPGGRRGWGAKGNLDLDAIRRMAGK